MDEWRELSKLLLQVASYHEELKPLISAELEGTHLFSGNIRLIRDSSIKNVALRPSALLFLPCLLGRRGFITLISSQLVDWIFLTKTVRKSSSPSLFSGM